MKKIKQLLTNSSKWTKRFLSTIPYKKLLGLIIELIIFILILYNIKLIMFKAVCYFDLLKYSTSIIALFCLEYFSKKV